MRALVRLMYGLHGIDIKFPNVYLVVVIIESFPVFPAIPLCVHHALKQDTGSVLRITSAFVQSLLDGEAGIQANAAK